MKSLQKGFTLIELMIVIAIIAILAAIAIPTYQNYLVRAHVSEGMSLADAAKTGVVEYKSETGKWPSGNSTAGVAAPTEIKGTYVNSVTVKTGTIEVAYNGSTGGGIGKNSQVLVLSPISNGGSIAWNCAKKTTVPSKYLPASCR